MSVKPVFDEAGNIVGIEISPDDPNADQTQHDANDQALRNIGRQAARIARGIDPVPANKDAVIRALCEAIARLIYATQYGSTE